MDGRACASIRNIMEIRCFVALEDSAADIYTFGSTPRIRTCCSLHIGRMGFDVT